MTKMMILVLMVLGSVATADRPMQTPKLRPRPFPPVDCKNVVFEIEELKGAIGEYSSASAFYFDGVVREFQGSSRNLKDLHTQYAALEGKSGSVPLQYFTPLQVQSEKLASFADEAALGQDSAWKISEVLGARIDQIVSVLPSCLSPTAK